MAVAVEMRGITKIYPGVVATDHVDFSVDYGHICGVIGENGAGKSTLMNILYGIAQPDSGTIHVNGELVKINSPLEAIALGIGMVHQHFMLMPNLSVLQNIILGSAPQKGLFIDTAAATEKITQIMKDHSLEVDLNAKVYQLSVGQKQRVEILKSLYRDAKILIMDEPTAVLTPQEVDGLLEVLRRLAKQGCAIIFITHKLKEIMATASHITVMRRGVVTGNVDTCDTNITQLAEMMVGRQIIDYLPREDFHPGDAVLRVNKLAYTNARGVKKLRDVSFSVRAGEIVGIAGVEGNGQTELVEVISGMAQQEAGTILLEGKEIQKLSVRKRREAGISHIAEDRLKVATAKDCSIEENLIMNRYYQKPYCSHGVMNKRKLRDFSEKLCQDFGIKVPDSTYLLKTLSGGNMQKVVLAREIETRPKLLLAAQPTRGVDIGAIEFLHSQILKLRDNGCAVLLVSTEMDEILALADRVLVIYEGEIVGQFDVKDADEYTLGMYMTGAKRQTADEGDIAI